MREAARGADGPRSPIGTLTCVRPDLGHRARTWSLRPHSRRRFASAAAAAADHDADDAAAADARTIVPEAADAPRSPPEASAPRGAVVWFRQDLRLDDNQAFRAAVRAANRRGGEVLCLFVWSPDEEGNDEGASWAPGEASRVWLHHSLDALDRDIRRRYGGGGVRFAAGEHASAVARPPPTSTPPRCSRVRGTNRRTWRATHARDARWRSAGSS